MRSVRTKDDYVKTIDHSELWEAVNAMENETVEAETETATARAFIVVSLPDCGEFDLTLDEAEDLWNELGQALEEVGR